jgi:hypothetical protein
MRPWGGFYEDTFLIDFREGESIYSDDMIPEIKSEVRASLHKIPKKYF